jgi:hypothetical protein
MEKLKALLLKYGIDISCFGKGQAKSLDHLLTEVEGGEAILIERGNALVRQIAVLNIDVFTDVGGRRRLVEDRQEFSDGRVRRRKLPASLAEKLHEGEDLHESIPRALEEELGVRMFSIISPISEKVETGESPSYPGLLSEYIVYSVEVLIDETEYREDYRETQTDKSTFFIWAE